MQLGERIKHLMKSYQWNQNDLASRTGLSQPFISAICRNEKMPSIENVMLLCKVLNITPNELLLESSDLIERSPDDLSDQERALLAKFRLLAPRDVGIVNNLVDSLLPREEGKSSISNKGKQSTNNLIA